MMRERTGLKLPSALPPASFQAAVSRHSDRNGIPPQLTVLTFEPQPLRFLGFQQILDMKNSWSLIYFDPEHQFCLLPCTIHASSDPVKHTQWVGEDRILTMSTLSSSGLPASHVLPPTCSES